MQAVAFWFAAKVPNGTIVVAGTAAYASGVILLLSGMRHPRTNQTLEDIDCALEIGDFPCRKADNLIRERGNSASSALLEEFFAFWGCANQNDTPVALSRCAHRKSGPLQVGHDARNRGRTHLFRVGKLAQRESGAEDDDRQGGELRSRESGGVSTRVLAPDPS